ncbi:MAG: Gfo/Idh/MocA family oxidoreductase, partial [candidate division Zixibacteria bacterium]|nr:Gfo/Idh/MocA family oxidoreductase [candidate division Zixibacteria bacterium]
IEMVKFAIIGAGSRGLRSYGKWIHDNPQVAQVVSVGDPLDKRCKEAVDLFDIAQDQVFNGWKELLDAPKIADAVIIATTDSDHVEPAILAAKRGYHILLEKPMAPTAQECVRIVDSVQSSGVLFTICHVLRYAPFYRKIKQLIDTGRVGKVCAIKHLEGIAWWHFAHSYVRGNWRNEALSSNILLAKCCHDLDILNWYAGSKCKNVQSFGELKYFCSENAPEGSAKRCMDCKYGLSGCVYSARKYYFENLEKGSHNWPLDVVTNTMTPEALETALRDGPYGRCVFHCDNDVMDTQSVNIEYENGLTVSMMLSAFTPHGRKIQIMGSDGFIEGDGNEIRILDFHTDQYETIDVNTLRDDVAGGHGGGDSGLMNAFVEAVEAKSYGPISGDAMLMLESHLLAFAAEVSRKQNRVVNFRNYCKKWFSTNKVGEI